MKKILVMILMLVVMCSSVLAQAEFSFLTATVTNYDPQPAAPGQFVTIYVKLENNGSSTAHNVVLEALPEYPFSIAPGQKIRENIGSLPAQSFHVAEFNVKVDDGAVQGSNDFKVRYNINEEGTSFSTKDLSINVQTLDAVLDVKSIRTTPEAIVPGQEAVVAIELENMADSRLTDISTRLDLTSDDIPLAPITSSSEKSLYQLRPGQMTQMEFNVIAFPDAEAKIYKVPLNVTYFDNLGTEYSKEELVGIKINSIPEIRVMVDSTTLMKDSKVGSVILKIVNSGLNDVKLMTLKLEDTEDFTLLSATNEEYIGNIDTDDFETVEFDLLLDGKDMITIPLEIHYRDSINTPFTENFNLNLRLHSSKDLGNGGSGGLVIFVLVVVVGVGIFIYRRRKKNKNK